MRDLIPFGDKSHQPVPKVFFVVEVGNSESFSLENREPPLDLIDPRAMNRSEVHLKTRMRRQPFLNLFTFMHAHIVQNQMDGGDTRINLPVKVFEKLNELNLSFAVGGGGEHLPRTGVESGEQIERAGLFVLVLDADRTPRSRPKRRRQPRSRLQAGFLVHADDHFPDSKRPGIEIEVRQSFFSKLQDIPEVRVRFDLGRFGT
jgi:hypothetical protein